MSIIEPKIDVLLDQADNDRFCCVRLHRNAPMISTI